MNITKIKDELRSNGIVGMFFDQKIVTDFYDCDTEKAIMLIENVIEIQEPCLRDDFTYMVDEYAIKYGIKPKEKKG